MTQIALRLPDALVREVDRLATGADGSRSAVIRRAIEQYVYRMACERDAQVYDEKPLTASELAFSDLPWEATPDW